MTSPSWSCSTWEQRPGGTCLACDTGPAGGAAGGTWPFAELLVLRLTSTRASAKPGCCSGGVSVVNAAGVERVGLLPQLLDTSYITATTLFVTTT